MGWLIFFGVILLIYIFFHNDAKNKDQIFIDMMKEIDNNYHNDGDIDRYMTSRAVAEHLYNNRRRARYEQTFKETIDLEKQIRKQHENKS